MVTSLNMMELERMDAATLEFVPLNKKIASLDSPDVPKQTSSEDARDDAINSGANESQSEKETDVKPEVNYLTEQRK